MKMRCLDYLALLAAMLVLASPAAASAGEEEGPAGDPGRIWGQIAIIQQQQTAEARQYAARKEQILRSQPPGPQRNLKLRLEYLKYLEESKRLSLQREALRREVISNLKQKWTKIETDWHNECNRHKAALQEIEKLPEGPERRARIERENVHHRSRSQQLAVERNLIHEGVIRQANLDAAGGSPGTSGAIQETCGTKVTDPTYGGMKSDFDGGGGYRTTEKAAKILNEMGVRDSAGGRVQVRAGVLETNPDFGMTINADPGGDRIGSAGHQAHVQQGAHHKETYVSEMVGPAQSNKPLKDYLAVLDHTKKALPGLYENPSALVGDTMEGQAMAKGALKAATQADLPQSTIEAIARKNGIKDPQHLLDRLGEIKSRWSPIESVEEAASLQGAVRDLLSASEAANKAKAAAAVKHTETRIADLEAKGGFQEAQKLRQELADYRTKIKTSNEALTHLEKTLTSGVREPTKTLSTPEQAGPPAGKTTGGLGKGEPLSKPIPKGGSPPVEPEPKAAGGGKLMRGGGLMVSIYGIWEGYETAEKEMAERKQGEPKGLLDWTATQVELAARTFWHGLGFGAMEQLGQQVGREAYEKYLRDIADGKIAKDSLGPYLQMKMQAALKGLYAGVKALTYDAAYNSGTKLGEAIKEGGGLGQDLIKWATDVHGESKVNEERSKQVYDQLIKKGASPVGAQRADDGVKRGDYTEAKRLNKILDGKLFAAQEASKGRSGRDRKKSAMKREAQRQEQTAREGLSEEQLELRETVMGKLRARGLPTGAELVDHLVGLLEKKRLPALESAIQEMTDMQGVFTGSIGGQGILRIHVQGTRVTGTWNNTKTFTIRFGDKTQTFTATASGVLQGDVELSSGTIAMKMTGVGVSRSDDQSIHQSIPFSGTFSGSFTGKGYKGSSTGTAYGESGSASWSVSR
jgi:uncharacterized coiled-coil protein SlyX